VQFSAAEIVKLKDINRKILVKVFILSPYFECYLYNVSIYNNKIWILGGWSDEENTEFKEVWSFDGSTWTQHTEIPWTKRKYVTSVEHDNKIFLLGGQTCSSGSSLNKYFKEYIFGFNLAGF